MKLTWRDFILIIFVLNFVVAFGVFASLGFTFLTGFLVLMNFCALVLIGWALDRLDFLYNKLRELESEMEKLKEQTI